MTAAFWVSIRVYKVWDMGISGSHVEIAGIKWNDSGCIVNVRFIGVYRGIKQVVPIYMKDIRGKN